MTTTHTTPTTASIIQSLIELKDAYEQGLEATSGELTDRLEAIEHEIMQMTDTAENKLERISSFYLSVDESAAPLQGQIAYHEARLKELKARAKSLDNLQERLKYLASRILHVLDVPKVKVGPYQISTRKTEALEVLDEKAAFQSVPEEFIRIKREIDKTALKAHIKASHVSFDGINLVTRSHISIK